LQWRTKVFLFTNLKALQGVDEIAAFIVEKGGLGQAH